MTTLRGLPALVTDVVGPLRASPVADLVRELVGEADVGTGRTMAPVETAVAVASNVDADTAAAMVARYAWLIDRVGAGIRLTAAGYLPPVHVVAAYLELGLDEDWIGKGTREDLTYPVLELRRSAQHLGLIRTAKGRLTVTQTGRRLRTDPTALLQHLARRIPIGATGSFERHISVLTLLWVAAGRPLGTGESSAFLAEAAHGLGWTSRSGERLTRWVVPRGADQALAVLEHAAAFTRPDRTRARIPTPGGRRLAWAALMRPG